MSDIGPEPVGAILERIWPQLSAPYIPTPLDDHLAWARKAVAILDALAMDAPAEQAEAIGALRAEVVEFGADVEALIGGN